MLRASLKASSNALSSYCFEVRREQATVATAAAWSERKGGGGGVRRVWIVGEGMLRRMRELGR